MRVQSHQPTGLFSLSSIHDTFCSSCPQGKDYRQEKLTIEQVCTWPQLKVSYPLPACYVSICQEEAFSIEGGFPASAPQSEVVPSWPWFSFSHSFIRLSVKLLNCLLSKALKAIHNVIKTLYNLNNKLTHLWELGLSLSQQKALVRPPRPWSCTLAWEQTLLNTVGLTSE